MRFIVPPHLKKDYKDFLQSDVCHTISICHDILAENQVWIGERAEINAINYKSKMYGSDNSVKIKVKYDSILQKGDMVKLDDKLYLCTWQINNDNPNCKATQIELANAQLTFYRKNNGIIDPNTGTIVEKANWFKLANDVRCVMTVGGSYSAKAFTNYPGIVPNNVLTVYLQANPTLMQLKRGDIFIWQGEKHVIHNLLYNELNYDGAGGLLVLNVELAYVGDANQ